MRPLYDKGDGAAHAATHDYVLSLDAGPGKAPLLSVFGGKLTTYRRLAEHALGMLGPHLPQMVAKAGWTGKEPLPGGDFPVSGFDALVADLVRRWPFLADPHARRLARLYGTLATSILKGTTSMASLGQDFGASLTQAEVDHLVRTEWARTAEDVVWRRTKLGLRLSAEQIRSLDEYLAVPIGSTADRAR